MPYIVGLFTPKTGIGTGTIINRRGLILTASHVIQGEAGFIVVARNYMDRLPESLNLQYRLVERYPSHDLALIHVPGLPLDGVDVPSTFRFEGLGYGEPVGSFGFPAATYDVSQSHSLDSTLVSITLTLRFKSYFISSSFPGPPPEEGPPSKFYSLDSFAYGGHSGGPVFDADGNIFAVMVQSNVEQGNHISFCEAACLSNIRKSLLHYQAHAPY